MKKYTIEFYSDFLPLITDVYARSEVEAVKLAVCFVKEHTNNPIVKSIKIN